ncbi:LysR substrate-binding domain-containing protein [Brenneria populi subsp. brevivirga]|uniref:LysR substrate-binding domain-containing protein n=1 Tax=Brenneria populi TaxID=1505588 RepID=UPI002E18A373|nr:LysR substrate-binding domain-containing protein [Brenneria populi subsp. brevivirga]
MLPPLRALTAFEAVARLGSIGAAARELHVTQSAVSQQLKSLERYLGCPLFERGNKRVALTDKAQQYLPVVAGSLQHLRQQTQLLFGDSQQADILTINANHSFGHNWLIPKLRDFTCRYPFIRLDLNLVDWPSREPCKDADIELTNGFVETGDTRAEKLFQEHWLMVCSPDFKARHQEALAKGELGRLPAVQVKGYEESWLQWLAHNHLSPVTPDIRIAISNSLHALQAVKHGAGMMLVRSLVAHNALKNKEVVLALNGSMLSESGHYLITKHSRSAKVSLFCQWLHSQYAVELLDAVE